MNLHSIVIQRFSLNILSIFQVAMRLLTSILALLFATMPLTTFMGKAGFTIWLWAIFFTFSGTFVLMPTATEKAFGAEHYSANYGLLFTTQVTLLPMSTSCKHLSFTNFSMMTNCSLPLRLCLDLWLQWATRFCWQRLATLDASWLLPSSLPSVSHGPLPRNLVFFSYFSAV